MISPVILPFGTPAVMSNPSSAPADNPDATESQGHHRAALAASLRLRFQLAEGNGDAAAKQALFQEAAYLNLPPRLWQGSESPDLTEASQASEQLVA